MKHRMRTLAFQCLICLLCVCLILPGVTVQGQGLGEDVEALLARMSPAERVGQLFMVGFLGNSVEQSPALLELIQKYRIGGVILTASNRNISPLETTEDSLRELIVSLQRTAFASGAIPSPTPLTTVIPPGQETPSSTATPTLPVVSPSPMATSTPVPIALSPTPRPASEMLIPLFVAVPHEDTDWLTGESGLQPKLSLMALGATWNTGLAEKAGAIMGETLGAVGVNMLLGPSVDLATHTRANLPGDLNTRTFGESPFWVSTLAKAYVRGLRKASEDSILSIATHFPGWGASDRDVYDEAPLLLGSLESRLEMDLLPFRRLVSSGSEGGEAPIDGLLVSHVQFRSVTSATQMTRPVSFDPQALQYFLSLPEVAAWRSAGGLTVSDLLGTLSVRRLYDPQEDGLQAKRVAYDAFLAGNDILCLNAMGATANDWEGHFSGIRDAVEFFHSKYTSDSAFRSRVDDSVRRILSAKLRLYGRFSLETVIPNRQVPAKWGEGWEGLSEIAGASVTLVYPRLDESVARMPAPPAVNERMVIFEDATSFSLCAGCEPVQRLVSGTTLDLLQKLYGQQGSGHVDMTRVQTHTLEELWDYLASDTHELEPYASLERAVAGADWLLFVTQSAVLDTNPASGALTLLLRREPNLIQGKRIVVIACGAPYSMDSTDVAKLSALYAVYSPARLSIEAGLRALFRELVPMGKLPVSVPAVQYSIAERLQPAPGQMLYAELLGEAAASSASTVKIGLGDELVLATGVIKDRNGAIVPDGTKVTFLFSYPAARMAWQQDSLTTDGRAQTTLGLDTSGTLEVRVASGDARNTAALVIVIAEDRPAVISTIVPTPSPTVLPTATPPSVFPGESEPAPEASNRPLDIQSFLLALTGILVICGMVAAFVYLRKLGWMSAELALLVFCAGMVGYLAYGFWGTRLAALLWFNKLRGIMSLRMQPVVLAWTLAGVVGILSCWQPRLMSRVTGMLRKLSSGQESRSNR